MFDPNLIAAIKTGNTDTVDMYFARNAMGLSTDNLEDINTAEIIDDLTHGEIEMNTLTSTTPSVTVDTTNTQQEYISAMTTPLTYKQLALLVKSNRKNTADCKANAKAEVMVEYLKSINVIPQEYVHTSKAASRKGSGKAFGVAKTVEVFTTKEQAPVKEATKSVETLIREYEEFKLSIVNPYYVGKYAGTTKYDEDIKKLNEMYQDVKDYMPKQVVIPTGQRTKAPAKNANGTTKKPVGGVAKKAYNATGSAAPKTPEKKNKAFNQPSDADIVKAAKTLKQQEVAVTAKLSSKVDHAAIAERRNAFKAQVNYAW